MLQKLRFTLARANDLTPPQSFTVCKRCVDRLLTQLPLNPEKEHLAPATNPADPCTICLDYDPTNP